MGKKVYELTLEIGHKASLLKTRLPNKPAYTHKWELSVRGTKGNKLDCIQKVVFELHESFDNPIREITEPPFAVKEIGYAGFEIPIYVHFKQREKPNLIRFDHDLCLLTDKPNESFQHRKIKFTAPSKEFEKCLIKSGAQLLTVSSKKERSDSPPTKKQKSSSLIPSKDMNKQQHSPLLQSQTPQPQISSSHHQKSSKHNLNHHSSNHHSSLKQSHNQHHQNHQHQHQTQSQPSSQKPKTSSREFIDIFGNPLAYNNGSGNNTSIDISATREAVATSNPILNSRSSHKDHTSKKSHSHKDHHKSSTNINNNISTNNHLASIVSTPTSSNHNSSNHHNHSNHKESGCHNDNSNNSHSSKHNHNKQHHSSKEDTSKEDQYANDLQYIQTKISCLSDCDRLQKIVDIVEEAGEWYNLTPKKFEFDLKRLDKKTLSRIEKCLN